MSVRELLRQRHALSRLALIGVLAPIVAAGCSSEKSRNPLSPNVAGPIAGVTISTPKTLQPSNGSEITVGSNIDLLIENATTNGERPLWQHVEVALDYGVHLEGAHQREAGARRERPDHLSACRPG